MQATQKAPDIKKLRLFDTCVTLGRMSTSRITQWLTPGRLIEAMDKYDIAEALVHHTEARVNFPRGFGNEKLLRDIEGLARLHAQWVLEPPDSPGPKAARAMVEEMLSAGVRSARLMMGHMPPLPWLWQDLCEALEEHRVPCFLDFVPIGWADSATTRSSPDDYALDHLKEICLAHPDLPMVLSHCFGGLGIARSTIRLIRRVPNLHIDITAILDYWRKVAVAAGPDRVFFATAMPFVETGIYIPNVQYAHEIDEAAKLKICGGNIRALLEAVR